MKKSILKAFENAVGSRYVSIDDRETALYSYDASQREAKPDIIIHPDSTEQVGKVLKICYDNNIPVTPRGAGAGFTGGSVPVKGGVALVMNRMNRIREIDTENLIAMVEPGVITEDFQQEVERYGLFYPPDPASKDFSTIGGNVAESAGGPRAFKYGVTSHYVLGLEAVLADGRVINTGSRTIKNVVGYNLTSLIVGSEGTLAVITAIILRLIPKPSYSKTSQLLFDSIDNAAETVSRLIASKIVPTTIEIMDEHCLDLVRTHLDDSLPAESKAALLVECDGEEEQVEKELLKVEKVARENGCIRFLASKDEEQKEELWRIRRSLSTLINRLWDTKVNEDIVVPRNRIPDVFAEIKELSRRYRIDIPSFGHAGDGNIHVNFMCNSDEIGISERVGQAVRKLFEFVVSTGGSISGEHGIGLTKAPYLEIELGDEEIDLMKRIKEAFDPKGILNPGKIFPT